MPFGHVYLAKKIRDTKEMFHVKMSTIKDRNSKELTEAENIKKTWQEYTDELYKKDLHDQDNHNGSDFGVDHLMMSMCSLPARGFSRQEYWSGLPFLTLILTLHMP